MRRLLPQVLILLSISVMALPTWLPLVEQNPITYAEYAILNQPYQGGQIEVRLTRCNASARPITIEFDRRLDSATNGGTLLLASGSNVAPPQQCITVQGAIALTAYPDLPPGTYRLLAVNHVHGRWTTWHVPVYSAPFVLLPAASPTVTAERS